jgi:hypothetical protein
MIESLLFVFFFVGEDSGYNVVDTKKVENLEICEYSKIGKMKYGKAVPSKSCYNGSCIVFADSWCTDPSFEAIMNIQSFKIGHLSNTCDFHVLHINSVFWDRKLDVIAENANKIR